MEHLMLKVDLSNRSYTIEEISKETIRKYIGGRGLGSYLLYNRVAVNADPLGEENHLIFTAGPASGTGLFFSSKACLHTKSPLTGIFLYSICSGILSREMRKAGLWAIDIKGVAEVPVYLDIHNHKVMFRDAASLWGMETAAAQGAMLEDGSIGDAATIAIGPAGEQMIKYASVFSQGPLYRCFGRGGAGAVMGSKKLKGFLVRGDKKVQIFDREGFEAINRDIAGLLKTDFKGWADLWRRYETGFGLESMHKTGILPTRNWQSGQFEGWAGISKSTTPMGWPEKGGRACGPYCPTPGCRQVEVKEGDPIRGPGVILSGKPFTPSVRHAELIRWRLL